jgi:hypothetical protein
MKPKSCKMIVRIFSDIVRSKVGRLRPIAVSKTFMSNSTNHDVRPSFRPLSVLRASIVTPLGLLVATTAGVMLIVTGTGALIWWRGKAVVEGQVHSAQDFMDGLHPAATKEISDFLEAKEETRPLLVFGGHHVGKSTAIVEALMQTEYIRKPMEELNSSEAVASPVVGDPAHSAQKVLIHIDLKHKTLLNMGSQMYNAFCASAYLSGRLWPRIGLMYFSVTSKSPVSQPQTVTSEKPAFLGKLMSVFGPIMSDVIWTVGLGAMEDRGAVLDTTLTLLSEATHQATDKRSIVLWISDAQNLSFQPESTSNGDKIFQNLLLERFKTGKSATNSTRVKTIVEVSDYMAGLAIANHPDQLFQKVVIERSTAQSNSLETRLADLIKDKEFAKHLVSHFKDALTRHTGEWHAVTNHARFLLKKNKTACSPEDYQKMADAIRSRLTNDGHNVIIKCLQSTRGTAIHWSVENWLYKLAMSDSDAWPIDRETVFDDKALRILLDCGVIVFVDDFDDERALGKLMFDKPSIKWAAKSRVTQAKVSWKTFSDK